MIQLIQNQKFKAFFLICLIFLTYGLSVTNGFVWDDDVYLTDRQLASSDGLKAIWVKPTSTDHPYYPLTHTFFWVLNKLFGRNAFVYHFVNIFIHALNCLLVWLILKRLDVRCAWMCAAVFALHPVQVETVAWVAQIKSSLSAFFYLLSMYWFIIFYFGKDMRRGPVSFEPHEIRLYALSVAMFVFSMLSKTAFCMLPFGLLIVILFKRKGITNIDFILTLSYFAVAFIVGLFTIWMEYTHVGSQGNYFSLSVFERALVAGRAVWFYALKLIFPYRLNFVYPRWDVNLAVWWQYLFPLGLIALIFGLWHYRKRIGLGWLCGVLFFIAHLFPVMGFFNIYMQRYTFVTDHWQYVASLGLIVIFVSWFEAVLKLKVKANQILFINAALLVLLAILSFQQSRIYKDRLTLFNDIVHKDQNSWFGYLNRGAEYLKQGKTDLAAMDFRHALLLNPNLPEAHNNLGNILSDEGKYEEAIAEYSQAIKINPGYYLSYVRRGVTYYYLKEYQVALEDFRTALLYKPDYPMTYNNRGLVYEALGDDDLALIDFETAVELDAFNFSNSYYNRARMKQKEGSYQAAIEDYTRAIFIDPDYKKAYNNRGVVYLLMNQFDKARSDLVKALAIDPVFSSAERNLRTLEQRQRNYDSR